ncbi:MAG: hypothetical protein K6C09_07085 [Oscillospiraceae bacterium]|nr:hypothetical protein [Oscillospiraceae bacterium]
MRPDGYKVKNADPMYMLIPYFLTKRYDAMNMTTLEIPVEPMKAYINARRREGIQLTHIGLVLAAFVRTVAEFPLLNRFIGGKKVYQHKDLTVSMVVLRPGGGDVMSKLYFDPSDDVFEVQRKIDEFVDDNRVNEDQLLDKAMKILLHIPGLMGAAIGILRFMDRHGLLPNALVRVSPFHASLLISNLASIRSNAIFHHVYDFGSTSIALTMGTQKEEPKRGPGGAVGFERCIPMGVVMDERICNGLYFSQAFSRFRSYLADPVKLEGKPEFEVLTMKQASELP